MLSVTTVFPKLLCPGVLQRLELSSAFGLLDRVDTSLFSGTLSHCLSVSIQELFGRNGFEKMMFQMFDSSAKDLLFSDDTECLSNLQNKTTYETYLGPQYLTLMDNFRQCLSSGKENGAPSRNNTRFKVSMFISRTQTCQVLSWHEQGHGEVETFSWPCRRIQLPLSRFS